MLSVIQFAMISIKMSLLERQSGGKKMRYLPPIDSLSRGPGLGQAEAEEPGAPPTSLLWVVGTQTFALSSADFPSALQGAAA